MRITAGEAIGLDGAGAAARGDARAGQSRGDEQPGLRVAATGAQVRVGGERGRGVQGGGRERGGGEAGGGAERHGWTVPQAAFRSVAIR